MLQRDLASQIALPSPIRRRMKRGTGDEHTRYHSQAKALLAPLFQVDYETDLGSEGKIISSDTSLGTPISLTHGRLRTADTFRARFVIEQA